MARIQKPCAVATFKFVGAIYGAILKLKTLLAASAPCAQGVILY